MSEREREREREREIRIHNIESICMCVYPFLYVCVYVGSCFGKGLQISINCTVMFKLSNHICSSTRIQRKRVRISERERERERGRERDPYT